MNDTATEDRQELNRLGQVARPYFESRGIAIRETVVAGSPEHPLLLCDVNPEHVSDSNDIGMLSDLAFTVLRNALQCPHPIVLVRCILNQPGLEKTVYGSVVWSSNEALLSMIGRAIDDCGAHR